VIGPEVRWASLIALRARSAFEQFLQGATVHSVRATVLRVAPTLL